MNNDDTPNTHVNIDLVNDAINASMTYVNEYEWVSNLCKSLHIKKIGIPYTGEICGIISNLTFKQYSNYLNTTNGSKILNETCHAYDASNEDDNRIFVLSDTNSHYYAFNYDVSSKTPLIIQAALNIMVNVAKNPMSEVLFTRVHMPSINDYIMKARINSFTNLVKSMSVFTQYDCGNLLDSWINDMNDGYLINPKIYMSAYPIMSKAFGNDWNRMIVDADMRSKLIGNDNVHVRQISHDSEHMITDMIQNIDDDSKMKIAVDYILDMDKAYSINASAIMSGYMGGELKEKFLANPYKSVEFAKNVLGSSVPLDKSDSEIALINEQFDLFIKSEYDMNKFKILNDLNKRKHAYDITEELALYYIKNNMPDNRNAYSKSIIDSLPISIMATNDAIMAFKELIEHNNLDDKDKKAFYDAIIHMIPSNSSYSYYSDYNKVNSHVFSSIFTQAYSLMNNNHDNITNDDIIMRIIECYQYAGENNYQSEVVFAYATKDSNIEYPFEYVIENMKIQYADNEDKIKLHY